MFPCAPKRGLGSRKAGRCPAKSAGGRAYPQAKLGGLQDWAPFILERRELSSNFPVYVTGSGAPEKELRHVRLQPAKSGVTPCEGQR